MGILKHNVLCGLSGVGFAIAVWPMAAKATSGGVHSKGMTVLRATFPSKGEVWDIQVRFSRNGEDFGAANIGLPRPWQLIRSVSYEEEQTTVLIPIAGFFATNERMLFFRDSGTYWFTVQVSFRDATKPRNAPFQVDKNVDPVVNEQIVEVGASLRADLDFIAGLANPDLLRAMYGEDFFERQTGDPVGRYADQEEGAVKVIGNLLSATRERDPTSIKSPKGDVLHAADILAALAKEIPESSYAPYAAYYAGCCYFRVLAEQVETMMKQNGIKYPGSTEAELKRIVGFISGQGEFARAKESLEMAISHADAYLKPLAIYMKGCLVKFTTDWDEAGELLDAAAAEAGGTGTIHDMVENARRDIQHARAKYAERKGELGQSSAP